MVSALRAYNPVIGEDDDCRLAGGWGGQKVAFGHSVGFAENTCRATDGNISRLPIVNPSALCHGFTMDKEAEEARWPYAINISTLCGTEREIGC